MELRNALLIYVIIFIVGVFVFLKLRIYPISSIILSLLICQIILNILLPPNSLNLLNDNDSGVIVYFIIQIGTPIILLMYIILRAWNDERHENNFCNL